MEDLNEQQRPLAEEILKISSVGIGGPYNALLAAK
jgi:4-carboxymuconolactone decarboxylase